MPESAVLAAIVARAKALGVADEVYAGRPDPLPTPRRKPILVITRDDAGAVVTALTFGADRLRYTALLIAYLGTPRTAGPLAASRAATMAALVDDFSADPSLGGLCVEARYVGDSTNLQRYRIAKEAPVWIGRLAVQEDVSRG